MEKVELRRLIIQKRLKVKDRLQQELAVSQLITKYISENEIQRVFSYMAFNGELSLEMVHQDIWKNGLSLALPLMAKKGQMSFHKHGIDDCLIKNSYGVLEPEEASELITPNDGDLVIVPSVALSLDGSRLGYGGGYYDRFLSNYPHVTRLAPAFSEQINEKIPTLDHDIKMNIVCTCDCLKNVTV